MIPRPKPGESEDDLLRFQQEFLAKQEKSAASLVKKPDKRKTSQAADFSEKDIVDINELPSTKPEFDHGGPRIPHKKSRFSASRDGTATTNEGEDPEVRIDKHDKHMAAVLTKIVERDTKNMQPFTSVLECSSGFPKVMHRGNLEQKKIDGTKKPRSLFAQQMSKMSLGELGLVVKEKQIQPHTAERIASTHVQSSNKSGPHIIRGTGLSATFGEEEAQKIHQENVNKMATMTSEEILEEKNKLLQMLDPKLVSFLTSKRNKQTSGEQTHTSDKGETMETTDSEQFEKKHNPKETEELDLPIKPDRKWIHMDKVEYDKLSWLKDLPPPSTDHNKTGTTARFDFEGNLVTVDEGIDVKFGLHHHGDEPERAGYSLEELFLLCRSTNIQQRILSLKTLGNILVKTRNGDLEDQVNSAILPTVLNAGILFLVRWAMDDSVEGVVFMAIKTLHSIIMSEADEESLDRVLPWFQGHVSPCLKTSKMSAEMTSRDPTLEDEKPLETDADILKRDVIYCLVMRMNLLPRLHHILSHSHPQAPSVLQCLEILIRIVRHSPQMAYEVERCHGLIELIVEEFLPTSWRMLDVKAPLSDLYGVPVPIAMKLVRCLAQSGRNLTATLLNKYHIKARFLRYIVEKNADDLLIPQKEALRLQIESYRTWRTCLCYGLASDLFTDIFPCILSQLEVLQKEYLESCPIMKSMRMTAFITVLESVVLLAAQCDQRKFGSTASKLPSDPDQNLLPSVTWSQITDVSQIVMDTCQKCLKNLENTYQHKKFNIDFEVSCLNFMSSYISSWSSHKSFDPVTGLQYIEKIFTDVLEPLIKSLGFQAVLSSLCPCSSLLNPEHQLKMEYADNLPGLGLRINDGHLIEPCLQEYSPLGMVAAVLRMLYVTGQAHKGLQARIADLISAEGNLLTYLRKMANSPTSTSSFHFNKYEDIVMYFFMKLVSRNPVSQRTVPLVQNLMLRSITQLQHGDEFLVHDLLSTVMFSPNVWKQDEDEMTSSLENLQLSDAVHLCSVTQEQVSVNQTQLVAATLSELVPIRAAYLQAFSSQQKMAIHSRHRFLMQALEVQNLVSSTPAETLLPLDWMYLPLIDLYNRFSSVGADVQNALSKTEVSTVTSVLRWVYLLERSQPQVTESVSVTLRVSRVMCTFLTGNNLFMDKTVYLYLAALLREFSTPRLLGQFNFDEQIPGIVSFYDLYSALLQQFEAVSFGDSLFSCYILLPIQQKHSLQLRKALWMEHSGILRYMHISLKEIPIPLDNFLNPEESDVELIRLYFQNLLSRRLQFHWSPLLYLIAIHHVNRFIYNQEKKHTQLKHGMILQTFKSPHKELCQHILHYKMADLEKDLGIELYTELPQIRRSLLKQVQTDSTELSS
ncbi:RNA polymerase II-associated protein 1-like [Saccostrea echinata]|uniref:RNA polymerase II-associated protein 1-like n=1 Tax=Saccostrea echinata TaxID=191078 RepID=UPI002A7EFF34|nr:RNA polymerase II-associated protein 1-like [Saccostrea echinata]